MSTKYPHEDLDVARERLEFANAEYHFAETITDEMVNLMPEVIRVMGEYDIARHVNIMTFAFNSKDRAENYYEYDIEAAPVCLCLHLWHSVERLAAILQLTMCYYLMGPWAEVDFDTPFEVQMVQKVALGPHERLEHLAMAQDIWVARCRLNGETPPDFEPIPLPEKPKSDILFFGVD